MLSLPELILNDTDIKDLSVTVPETSVNLIDSLKRENRAKLCTSTTSNANYTPLTKFKTFEFYKNKIFHNLARKYPSVQFEVGFTLNNPSDVVVNTCDTYEIPYKCNLDLNPKNLNYDRKMLRYNIEVTNAGILSDQIHAIFHAPIKAFDFSTDESELHLKSTLKEILRLALQHNCRILTLPALGTTSAYDKYLPCLCAEWMIECINEFFFNINYHPLELIRIVIDEPLLEAFNNYLKNEDIWTTSKVLSDDYYLQTLVNFSQEFSIVYNYFIKRIRPGVFVDRIEKVNNPYLLTIYNQNKDILRKQSQSNKLLEYKLFYIQHSYQLLESVCKKGFYSTGNDILFSNNAEYAHECLKQNDQISLESNNQFSMILANVLDEKQFKNDQDNDSIVQISKLHRAYPLYIIHYKCND